MICFDPNATFDFTLPSHERLSDPPVFTARYLTWREHRAMLARFDDLIRAQSDEDAATAIVECFSAALRGWKGIQGVPYSPENVSKLLDVFSFFEIRELMERIVEGCVLGARDKKK